MSETSSIVLLAVSDQNAALLYRAMLEMHRLDVAYVADGFDAAEYALRERPALVIVEQPLAGLDGLSVCRLIKARRGTDTIPVIVITLAGDRENTQAIVDAGADQLLVEPCAPELVALEARRLIGSARTPRLLRSHDWRRASDLPMGRAS